MGLDDKRWTMAVGKQHDSVLPSRQSLDVGSLIPRDFILGPGTSSRVTPASLCGVFRTHCLTRAVGKQTSPQATLSAPADGNR